MRHINPRYLPYLEQNGAFLDETGDVFTAQVYCPIVDLALKLAEAGKTVDYALVWDRPHCQADYPGKVCRWIEAICAEADNR